MNSSESIDVDTDLGRLHVGVTGSGAALVMWPSLLMDASV